MRHTSRLCSACWYVVRPNTYFPDGLIWGEPCCSCGDVTQTARVSKWEAQTAAYVINSSDRPACCRVEEASK